MRCSIKPSSIAGSCEAPESKSMAQRAVALALLAEGESSLAMDAMSDDARAALGLARALGAGIRAEPGLVSVRGTGGRLAPRESRLEAGESGLSFRMFSSIACLSDVALVLEASGSLRSRPVSMAEAPLRALGAECASFGGFPPLTVKGPLKGGRASVDGSTSSQFLTGLLFALPCCPEDSEIEVEALASKPYVEMSLAIMRDFGARVEREGYERFIVPGGQRYRAREYRVEGDWSGAAFLLAAGAIASDKGLFVGNLDERSLQADRAFLRALEAAGAPCARESNGYLVSRGELRGFDFDATECPDLFPPLAALALHCRGTSRLKGAGRLKHKESDRAATLCDEFAKMGGRLRVEGDEMIVEGSRLRGAEASGRGDHRIAMALAVAALGAEEETSIEGAECVAKSFPDFFERMGSIGMAYSSST
jgi:3-phosphoshikimate 1-carboxyvinyltransferase